MFGIKFCEPSLVSIMLQNTDCNNEKLLDEVRGITNNLMFKSLSNFGKITLVKSFVLSEISHIESVLPTPTLKKCKVFDDVMHDFSRDRNHED